VHCPSLKGVRLPFIASPRRSIDGGGGSGSGGGGGGGGGGGARALDGGAPRRASPALVFAVTRFGGDMIS